MSTTEEKGNKDKKKSKILVVDDHAIVRRGLSLLVNQEPDLVVSAEAEDADQALQVIDERPVDLAVVDISLNRVNGIELTEKIKSQYPHLPVLILTMHDEAIYARRAFEAGAEGYITKHEAAETIITAIRLMLAGKHYVSKNMAQKISENNS